MKNLIIILTIILSLSTALSVNAENDEKGTAVQTSTLSGKVLDKETGEALVGVKIEIKELNIVSYTDFDGNFSFANLQKGNYNIATDYISYKKSVLKDINLENKNNLVKIELQSN